jgi:hypothetical protein
MLCVVFGVEFLVCCEIHIEEAEIFGGVVRLAVVDVGIGAYCLQPG